MGPDQISPSIENNGCGGSRITSPFRVHCHTLMADRLDEIEQWSDLRRFNRGSVRDRESQHCTPEITVAQVVAKRVASTAAPVRRVRPARAVQPDASRARSSDDLAKRGSCVPSSWSSRSADRAISSLARVRDEPFTLPLCVRHPSRTYAAANFGTANAQTRCCASEQDKPVIYGSDELKNRLEPSTQSISSPCV